MAVVFDLDGTLVDSLPDIAGHLNAALVASGYRAWSLDNIRALVGTGAERLVASVVPESERERVPEVLERFRASYRAAPFARTRVYAGLEHVLDVLRAQARPLGVLSNKPHDLVVAIADGLLARWRFEAIVGERPGRAKKPDPNELVAMLAALGAGANATMVGDSEIDIATARAAGVRAIGVAWGLRSREQLEAAQPDAIAATPAELLALLDIPS